MNVLVLGAGIIGTTTAWYLRRAGHEVTVLDRQPAAAMETSFANGGQISVSHVEPWANPQAPFKVLQWLGQEDAPLLYRPRLELQQWLWGTQFLFECLPARTRRNMLQILAISKYSGEALKELRAETGIAYDQLERGILQLYSDSKSFDVAVEAAQLVQRHGVRRVVKSRAECVAIEPALAPRSEWIVGGTYTDSDESGDAHLFAQRLAERAAQQGVQFRYGVAIQRIAARGGQIVGVDTMTEGRLETFKADAYVAALGSYTPLLVKPLGVRCLVYPAKGYSATLPIIDAAKAPTVSVTDDAKKIVFSRLGNRLRVAGTAELNGYNLELNSVRCAALTQCALAWFAGAVDVAEPEYWTGLRPATPSNVPLIGRTRYPNLYLNTGHGTLGWTMGAGSGKALAEIISGRKPELDFDFLNA
jgi:D-amino-acid dehydrogenase